jgi:hypothetical protein
MVPVTAAESFSALNWLCSPSPGLIQDLDIDIFRSERAVVGFFERERYRKISNEIEIGSLLELCRNRVCQVALRFRRLYQPITCPIPSYFI